jgi:hypothetical protein
MLAGQRRDYVAEDPLAKETKAMMYFGLLLVICGLLLPVWAAIKDKPFFKKVFASSFIIIFVGIVLTFGDRLEEITVENVGSIKTAVVKANQEADEISNIRKRIEAQADKIDLVAKKAKSALNNIKDVQNVLDSMKTHGDLARINFNGSIPVGGGMSTGSPLSGWNGGFVSMYTNRKTATFRIQDHGMCTPAALDQYKSIIKQYPFWPFSHYVLALCLKQQGDKSWEEHAVIALKIFEKTTAVPNHNPDHSTAMKGVKKMLQQ